jgi:hypothetical protein
MGTWFNFEHLESDDIETNSYYKEDCFENGEKSFEGLTVLEHQILIEEFYHFEKMKNDFLIFLTKFFDNTKTNIYSKIMAEYEKQTKTDFYDYFFKTVNIYSYMFDFSKTKKNLICFVKVILETTNEETIKKLVTYFKKNIVMYAGKTKKAHKSMTQRGRINKIIKSSLSIQTTPFSNLGPRNCSSNYQGSLQPFLKAFQISFRLIS